MKAFNFKILGKFKYLERGDVYIYFMKTYEEFAM